MYHPIYLYAFRLVAILSISTIAFFPLVTEVKFSGALMLFPTLVTLALVVVAILEQRLLRKVSWQKVAPIKAHKTILKPVRLRKHAGCKLLGLPCAA